MNVEKGYFFAQWFACCRLFTSMNFHRKKTTTVASVPSSQKTFQPINKHDHPIEWRHWIYCINLLALCVSFPLILPFHFMSFHFICNLSLSDMPQRFWFKPRFPIYMRQDHRVERFLVFRTSSSTNLKHIAIVNINIYTHQQLKNEPKHRCMLVWTTSPIGKIHSFEGWTFNFPMKYVSRSRQTNVLIVSCKQLFGQKHALTEKKSFLPKKI